MTEETSQEVVEEVVEQPEYTEVEQKALAQGWKPKDELEEGKEFISADEFLRRGELFDKIKSLKDEIHHLKSDLGAVVQHHAQVKESEFKRAVEYLKAEKKSALDEGDHERVIEIDDQIAEVREAQKLSKQPSGPADNPQIRAMQETFVSWVDDNGWYNQNEELHDYADSVGLRYRRTNPDWSYEKILSEVAKKTKERFPEHFGGVRKSAPPSPDSGGQGIRSSKKGKLSESDLSDDERRAMNVFVQRIPGFSKEKYLAELQAVRGA